MATGDRERLTRAIGRTRPKAKQDLPDDDPLLEALRRRGIVAPAEDRDDNRPWWQQSLELVEANQAAEARKNATKVEAPKSAAQILAEGLRGQGGQQLPLNGAALLRHALGGASGTVNGAEPTGRIEDPTLGGNDLWSIPKTAQ